MRWPERLFNILLGLSIVSWGIIGISQAIISGDITLIRVTVTVLNLVVGTLILLRKPLCQSGSTRHILLCLPSFALCGLAFYLSLKTGAWHPAVQAVFVGGGLWTVASFIALGRNMAILPAVRSISKCGPYQVIRHPAYLGELMMAAACCMTLPPNHGFPLVVFIAVGVVVRVIVEEQLLAKEREYQAYRATVKWRLIPLCW